MGSTLHSADVRGKEGQNAQLLTLLGSPGPRMVLVSHTRQVLPPGHACH